MIMQNDDFGTCDVVPMPTDGIELSESDSCIVRADMAFGDVVVAQGGRSSAPGMMYGFVPLDPHQAIRRLDGAHNPIPGTHLNRTANDQPTEKVGSRNGKSNAWQTELYFG